MKFCVLLLSLISTAFAGTVSLGKIEFEVDTSVKMFRFKGQAQELQSKLERSGAELKTVELTIPVESLKTGMNLRDKHMRERIFTAKDGKTPDVVFKAGSAKCESSCDVTGTLTIRGETRPQLIHITLKNPTHAQGTAKVELSKFGIEPPSQAGVKVSDAVDVSFEVDLK